MAIATLVELSAALSLDWCRLKKQNENETAMHRQINAIFVYSLLIQLAAASDGQNARSPRREVSLKGVACVVERSVPADRRFALKYKEGVVYFSSREHTAKYRKTPKKYEAWANFQLFQTGQYVQRACPLSGEKPDEYSGVLNVGGVDIELLCPSCAKEMSGLSFAEQIETLFDEEGFGDGHFSPPEPGENLFPYLHSTRLLKRRIQRLNPSKEQLAEIDRLSRALTNEVTRLRRTASITSETIARYDKALKAAAAKGLEGDLTSGHVKKTAGLTETQTKAFQTGTALEAKFRDNVLKLLNHQQRSTFDKMLAEDETTELTFE